jgi:hypothetical protein
MNLPEEIITQIFEYLPLSYHLFLIHEIHISSVSLSTRNLIKFGSNFEKMKICKSCVEILTDSLRDDLMMEYGTKFYGEYEIPTEDEKEEIAQEKWETDSEDDEKMEGFLHKTAHRIYQMAFIEYLFESGQMEDFEMKGKCVLHSMKIDFDPEEVYQHVLSIYRKGIEEYHQDDFCWKCARFHSGDCSF